MHMPEIAAEHALVGAPSQPRLLFSSRHEYAHAALRLDVPGAEAGAAGQHRMRQDVVGRHHPEPADGHIHGDAPEHPAAQGLCRGQAGDPGGGPQVVLERYGNGRGREEGDWASHDPAGARSSRRSAAGACQPVHRGWFDDHLH